MKNELEKRNIKHLQLQFVLNLDWTIDYVELQVVACKSGTSYQIIQLSSI